MKRIVLTVLALIGVQAFAKDASGKIIFTEDQLAKLKTAGMAEDFAEKFSAAFAVDPEKDTAESKALEDSMITALQKQVLSVAAAHKVTEDFLTAEKAAHAEALKIVTERDKTIKTLSRSREDDPPATVVDMKTDPKAKWIPKAGDTHLFGIAEPHYAIDDAHPYNQRAFAVAMGKIGISIASPMAITPSIDYQSLKADLGEFYRVRKQDAIVSFLQTLPTLKDIFPSYSGYQDQSVLVNAFFSEFSQAGNESSDFDTVVKGSVKLEPEILTMYPVMFAHKFKDMKSLEKTWIGYLNREGSGAIKWSFIEYIMVEVAKVLKNEQEMRWISGVRIEPSLNVPGTAMGGSNGLLKFLKNKIANFQIQPFKMGEWDDSTIAEYIRKGTQMVPAILRNSGKFVLHMSPDTLSSYFRNLEALYGKNQDYTAGNLYVKEFPSVKIIVLPNMTTSKRLIWTFDGNLGIYEDLANEMLNFSFEQVDWALKVWSSWKESIQASAVGKKYASLAEMPADFSNQMIFVNDVDEPASYYLQMAADDTTPSVLNHTSLVSVANSQATAITAIDDCAVGQEIRIQCGPGANSITIAKAGVFSLLSAAWNPVVGNILILKKRSDGKFIELKRISFSTDALVIAADDATPTVKDGVKFITSINTVATAITALDDAIVGVVYTLMGGSDVNATTIANAGNFSLTAPMTLGAGKFITLQKSEQDGKLYEITRG